jgi:hypothetical protein
LQQTNRLLQLGGHFKLLAELEVETLLHGCVAVSSDFMMPA